MLCDMNCGTMIPFSAWLQRMKKVYRIKHVMAALGIVILVGAGGVFIYGKYSADTSSNPDAAKQQILVRGHAYCAGFYVVMRSSLRENNPDYAELEKTYRTEVERHVQAGLNLSLERDKFESMVESTIPEISEKIISASEKEKVISLVENQMADCVAILFQTIEFIKSS